MVCRHWRNVALATPSLWNHVNISLPSTAGNVDAVFVDNSDSLPRLSLKRSGALSLELCYKTTALGSIDTSYLNRVQELCLISIREVAPALLCANFHHYINLKTLFVESDSVQYPSKGDLWTIATLEVLVMFACPLWEYATLGNLRHLVIGKQELDTDSVLAFFNVLSGNPSLEDLVLPNIGMSRAVLTDLARVADLIPTLHMHSLKRIHVVETGPGVIMWLFDQKLLLDAGTPSVRAYTCEDSLEHYLESPALRNDYPFRVVYMDYTHVIATHGESALRVRNTYDMLWFFQMILPSSLQSQTVELRVSRTFTDDMLLRAQILGRFSAVRKLVLHNNSVTDWLDLMTTNDRFFPSLIELEIYPPYYDYRASLVSFLDARKRRGEPIQELRILQPSWEPNLTSVFTPYVVGSVIFEDVNPRTNEDHPDIELPPMCNRVDWNRPYSAAWRSIRDRWDLEDPWE